MPVRGGVIGAGGIADRRTISEGPLPSPQCQPLAVMDTGTQRAQAIAQQRALPRWYAKAPDLPGSYGIPAAYTAAPTCLRKKRTAVAQAGKHPLLDTPLAQDDVKSSGGHALAGRRVWRFRPGALRRRACGRR